MKLTVIHTGYFKLDGGAMFGVVPRRMWSKMNPPDADNMCTWAMRCLLVQTGERNILIDTGLGNKQDEKFRSHFLPHGTENLFDSLQKAGLGREDITDVILTHLHFDHCGGALWRNEQTGEVEASFPKAIYWSTQQHFDWAMTPNEREKASFLKENFLPLYEQGRMKMIPMEENYAFLPEIRIRFAFGHTEAMMIPVIQHAGGTLIYCADLLPSQWHVGMPYVMAYDIRPLVTLEEKKQLLIEAAMEGQTLFFEHDPTADCGRVKSDDKGRVVLEWAGFLRDE